MRGLRGKKSVLKACHIYGMLKARARGKHVSFHTPGHKSGKWDITELSYSDNLASPRGCIARAEADIAKLLGATKSFILTDGSTAGVFSMLYAVKRAGAAYILVFENAHRSAFNACAALGLTPLVLGQRTQNGIPLPVGGADIFTQSGAYEKADALLLTSPDYYGNIAALDELAARCAKDGKYLLVDGAHGGHLHFDKARHAGAYADLWVDGVHKSLPALTQGAVVSAKDERLAGALYEGVQTFRTTSPSYPIMASVEYAVKYPRNEALERAVRLFSETHAERVYASGDWTKLCALFGENAFAAERELENAGVYAEFCDGNAIVFYLSPATEKREWNALCRALRRLFAKYPYSPKKELQRIPAPLVFDENAPKEWVDIGKAAGRVCAADCGLFPPCTPLIRASERINGEKLALLEKADNAFGVCENKLLVYADEARE